MTGKFNKTPEEEMKKNGETLLQELAIFDGYLAKVGEAVLAETRCSDTGCWVFLFAFCRSGACIPLDCGHFHGLM